MGKRSSFERIPRDILPTPAGAVPPLIPHLRGVHTFAEPCCGDGALVHHLESFGLRCAYAGDIATGQDALALDTYGDADAIITNPPLQAPAHARADRTLRAHLANVAIARRGLGHHQAGRAVHAVVFRHRVVGRVRWIEGTTMSGRQNFAWYRFDARQSAGPIFMRVIRHQCHRESACAFNAARHIGRSDPTPRSARTHVGNAPIASD